MKKIIIQTKRLLIVPQSMEDISILFSQEIDKNMKLVYQELVETMQRSPGKEEWGTMWKISLNTGPKVGAICFKGLSDTGVVEIGYGIDNAYQNNGYATEAVGGVLQWAKQQNGIHGITAQTEPGNKISQKVLLKNGFVHEGNGNEGLFFAVRF